MPDARTPSDEARRVVVTGLGVVSALGRGLGVTFDLMAEGRSGIDRITRFDPTGLPCDIAGEVDAEDLLAPHPLDARGGTAMRLYRTALEEALPGARLPEGVLPRRAAVILGGHGYTPREDEAGVLMRHADAEDGVDVAGLVADPAYDGAQMHLRMPDTVPGLVARLVGARGPAVPIVSACAAGTQAIGEGLRLLRDGRADLVITGGVEPLLTYTYFVGFALLGALVRRYPSPAAASRPFDRRRGGFVIAEGAGALVLETLEGARARGRPILGEVLGYGDSSDAFNITDVHPRGDGALAAMRRALESAGVEADAIEYVNAHGTSTQKNDPVETLALKRLFGDRASSVPLSSNKSMIGHTIGAAGAIEAALTFEGMRRGVMLPTINQEAPDPRCDLDVIPNEARAKAHHLSLSNSFGFGGQNGCLCLGAAERI